MSIENYGNYQLLQRLATGGMAQIYLARQRGPEGFEKLLVVKRILPHLAENEEFVRMFLDEARIAARLNHPNIVQIFDLGAQDDSFFIAMEYIHGEDLRRVWKRAERGGNPLPVPLVCRVIIEACAGLDYAHKKTDGSGKPLGIVHRDISPQNILLTFEGRVKVVDFGIAKAADQATVTRSGVLKGKYSYMSPEQAAGQKVDRRSDIFALGVVLYELLTGARLFKRSSDMATLKAVAECQLVPPSRVNPRVPEHLDAIVMKALAREPGARYAEAAQLQLALEDWLVTHQLASSSAHVAAFMKELYAARLAEEARRGEVLVEAGAVAEPPPPPRSTEAETVSAPRPRKSLELATTQPLEAASLSSLERPSRTSPRSPRSESRSTSERKALEPRRTSDSRRGSRVKHQALPAPRKSNRLLVGLVSALVLGGVAGGAWWRLRPILLAAPPPESSKVVSVPEPAREPEPLVEPAPASEPEPEPLAEPPPAAASAQPEEPPVVRKQEPPRPVAETRPAEPRKSLVRFVVRPTSLWADITCNGQYVGQTPLTDRSMAVGHYACTFSNPDKGTRTRQVEVKPNIHNLVVVDF